MRGVYPHPRKPGIWCIHWYDHLGQRHREVVGSKDAANLLYHKRKSDSRLMHKLPELRRAAVKFSELAAEARAYCQRHHRRPGDDLQRLERIEREFGRRPAAAIQPREIDAWLRSLGVSPATENRYKATLSVCYRLAMQEGKVSVNPARLVRIRRENNKRVRWLTPDEERKLFETIEGEPRWRRRAPVARFAMLTGLRRSEQSPMVWSDIDWINRQATVRRSKHGESRFVPLNASAVEILKSLVPRLSPPPERRIFTMGESALDGGERWIERTMDRTRGARRRHPAFHLARSAPHPTLRRAVRPMPKSPLQSLA